MTHYEGWPETQVYRGRDGLREFLSMWFEPWDEFHLEITETHDLPGERVYVEGRNRGRGRASGIVVELPPIGQFTEFRNGQMLRAINYSNVEEARAEAERIRAEAGA